MADVSNEWKEQEREIIDTFFREKVPQSLGPLSSPAVCTEEACISFASETLQAGDLLPVDNQGSKSFTLTSPSQGIVVQFRLKRFREDILSLANSIYGNLVPSVHRHDGFVLPVYSSNKIPGRVHLLQPFPRDRFPLEREMATVRDLGVFVARAAHFPQAKSRPRDGSSSWTQSAGDVLRRLGENASLRNYAPELSTLVSETLLPRLPLLDTLPAVLTHHDFAQVNILVDDTGHLTGVIDFDEAGIEAFGMCIWGLYECFFGSMEDGKWSFYNMEVDGCGGKTVFDILEATFWDSLADGLPSGLQISHCKEAVMVALSVGVINRYFIRGMLDEIDLSKRVHCLSLEYARGILPDVWKRYQSVLESGK